MGKPDPRIFRAATEALGVPAEQSLFIDDCLEEADGAREFGFTAFHLDRTRREPDLATWTLSCLADLLPFLERCQP